MNPVNNAGTHKGHPYDQAGGRLYASGITVSTTPKHHTLIHAPHDIVGVGLVPSRNHRNVYQRYTTDFVRFGIQWMREQLFILR